MLDIADGAAVLRVLDRAARAPELYRRLIVSSPFIDDYGITLLSRLGRRRGGNEMELMLVVTPETAERIRSTVKQRVPGMKVVVQERLHAKVYALLGRKPVAHEALVTSSNLTTAGIGRNLELGVHLRGSNERLVTTIERIARRVTT